MVICIYFIVKAPCQNRDHVAYMPSGEKKKECSAFKLDLLT